MLQQLEASKYKLSSHDVTNAQNPHPFGWFFDSAMDFIITVSTKGKNVLKIVLKNVSILFRVVGILSLWVTFKIERME